MGRRTREVKWRQLLQLQNQVLGLKKSKDEYESNDSDEGEWLSPEEGNVVIWRVWCRKVLSACHASFIQRTCERTGSLPPPVLTIAVFDTWLLLLLLWISGVLMESWCICSCLQGVSFFSSSTSRDNNFSMLVKDSRCAKLFFFVSFETQLYRWFPTLHFGYTNCSKINGSLCIHFIC
jgi:hypothetical protein